MRLVFVGPGCYTDSMNTNSYSPAGYNLPEDQWPTREEAEAGAWLPHIKPTAADLARWAVEDPWNTPWPEMPELLR